MKKLFFIFFLIFFAILIGFFVQKDAGYVLIAYNGWTVETSLWIAVLAAILLFFLVYFLLRLVHKTMGLGERWKMWRNKRRHHKMHEKIEQGIFRAIEGEWADAEKQFKKAAELNSGPIVAYLGAAMSANQEGAYERCEEYLKAAERADPESERALLFARAQFCIQRQDWDSAEKFLLLLKEKTPRNKLVLTLLEKIYLEKRDWEKVRQLQKSTRRRWFRLC